MSAEDQIRDSIDHLFRHRAGQMVSVLVRQFGVANIELVEDAVQDALVSAMKKWPYSGVPDNQSAWLIQTAKNRVIDQLRRDAKSDSIDANDIDIPEEREAETRFESELTEDQVRMMFACCNPAIPADSRVALTLKIVGGFTVSEIARAYLANDEAIAKMLTRAKQRFRTIDLEIPAGIDLKERLDAVLRVLYLMFNEGYSASEGSDLFRQDLCEEAIRLARILLGHPLTSMPLVHALTALFLFQAARLTTRIDAAGDLLLLADQDRSQWDRGMLATGLDHFRLAASGNELNDYHIEAEIASLHALAPDYSATDWEGIIGCYDALLTRRFSPVVTLNRLVAVGESRGAEAALDELSGLASNYLMTSFNLYHVTRAHFLAKLGRHREAADSYAKAAELTKNETVLRFIRRKIEMLKSYE
ncbi:MAG TPA: sigma-70 family RNA polymerase sigma factor [Pyrinomonadaceae bacterium]|nr:sigma-70 family RNA polymerase sigma factor [Pyrinomonadaceae bacterium]